MPAIRKTVLILGGTREAAELAALLSARGDLRVITSLAGRTDDPGPVEGERRIGGFGGVSGLASFLRQENIDILVDATHPYAEEISAKGASAAQQTDARRLVFRRPSWTRQEGDLCTMVPSLEAAREAIPVSCRALLALGRQHIAHFAKRGDVQFLIRMVDPPKGPLPIENAQLVLGKPGTMHQEEKLFRSQDIDVLVCRNSGGDASFAKIEAARRLSLPVIMIKRPCGPEQPCFETIEALAAVIG